MEKKLCDKGSKKVGRSLCYWQFADICTAFSSRAHKVGKDYPHHPKQAEVGIEDCKRVCIALEGESARFYRNPLALTLYNAYKDMKDSADAPLIKAFEEDLERQSVGVDIESKSVAMSGSEKTRKKKARVTKKKAEKNQAIKESHVEDLFNTPAPPSKKEKATGKI